MASSLQFRGSWGRRELPRDARNAPRHLLGPGHEQANANPPDFEIEPQEGGWFSHPFAPRLAGRANSRPATRTIPHTIEFSEHWCEAIASHTINRNIADRNLAEKLHSIEGGWLSQSGGAERIALQFRGSYGRRKLPGDVFSAPRHLLGPGHKQADANPPDFEIEPQEDGWLSHPFSPQLAGRAYSRSATGTIPHTIEFSEWPRVAIVSQPPAPGFKSKAKNKNAAWEGTSP
jgi:hypothetical protein